MDLSGKTVLITGVSRGIGRALVDLYLEKEAKVAGMGLRDPQIKHPNFRFYQTDVRDYQALKKSFDQMQKDFGKYLHILINNAGLGYFGPVEGYSPEQIQVLFETNVYPLFYTAKLIVPQMKAHGFGHIVNISSTAGLEAYPQVSAYCGTKFAVKAISESMYKELRDYKIKVTCVYPGSVKTDFFRHNENIQVHDYMLMPEDVAMMIVQATETPDNFHQVSLEVRPLQPKGPRNITGK